MKNLVKKFGQENAVDKKNSKKIFVKKKFLPKRIWPKKCLSKKKFQSQNILPEKNLTQLFFRVTFNKDFGSPLPKA